LLSLGFGFVLENNVIHEVFFFKISIIHFQQLTYVQKLGVRCGKCRLSAAKERFSLVGALLKVVNFKRSDNQSSRVARCGKYMLSTATKRFFIMWRAVESNYFPQLRSVFYKAVRC
jgi:hypothetical protein